MYTKGKQLILYCAVVIILIITIGTIYCEAASFTLQGLVNTPDEIIHLPPKDKNIGFDLRPALVTYCSIATDPQYVPPSPYPNIWNQPGVRIEIWAIYHNPATQELKALHKIIMKEGPYKKFTYWGSGEGPDLVNVNSKEISEKVKALLGHGNNCFFGFDEPETTTETLCATGDGTDCLIGGPNIDTLDAGEGNDICWGRGPGQFDNIVADSIPGDEVAVPGTETYVP